MEFFGVALLSVAVTLHARNTCPRLIPAPAEEGLLWHTAGENCSASLAGQT